MGDIDRIRQRVVEDARALARGGADGLMLENFGDAPFFPDIAPAHTLTVMTALALAVRDAVALPLGINVLRNDARGALAVALAAGADYLRVNVLTGARVTDQGVVQGGAHKLLRLRKELGCETVQILADIDVKHSSPLGSPPALSDEVDELLHRGLADALIVSGSATGKAVDTEHLRRVRAAAESAPVLVGSGVTTDNVAEFLPYADGFIVGSSLKEGGQIEAPVDESQVDALVRRMRDLGGT